MTPQALAARSSEEVDDWLSRRTVSALQHWRALAEGSLTGFNAEGRSLTGFKEEAGFEEAAMYVHAALYPRDNLTDVRMRIEAMVEQASYIWFTRELETGALSGQAGLGESPLKDPSQLLPGEKGGGTPSSPSSVRRKAKGVIQRRSRKRRAVPHLRVVSAAKAGALSRENALHSINLLLFDIFQFKTKGAATPEQSSLPPLLRRGGGNAGLLPLCVLYAALSRKLGVALELVRFDPPSALVATRPPGFLLRMPPQDGEFEIYVDVLAGGRLRSTHDLGNYLSGGGLSGDLDRQNARLRQFVLKVEQTELCLELMRDLESACVFSNMLAEAAFWKVPNK